MPAVATLGALLLGIGAGAFADQNYPEYLPALSPGHTRAAVDHARLDEAVRVIGAHYDSGRTARPSGLTLTRGGIRGLVQSLGDPYSTYEDPRQYRQQQDNFSGRHTGVVGVYLLFPGDYPKITGLVPGGPAQRAGLHAGDLVTAIDGRDARGLKAQETQALIDGRVGTSVTLTVLRGTETLAFTLERSQFTSPMVAARVLDDRVLYMRVYQFGTATTSEFDAQLKANLPGARAVVLDLRDNPGGYISAASAMISRFVAAGEAFELRDRDGRVDRQEVAGEHPAADLPLVVLVNSSTASASEIVAGSLQAHRRARLVGEPTFGKGSVQVDFPLSDGSDLHLTVQHWFLPNGQFVDRGSGLRPDVPVALEAPDSLYDPLAAGDGRTRDAQLARALDLLSQR